MLLEAFWEHRLRPASEVSGEDDRQCPSSILMFAKPGNLRQGSVSQFELDRWADDGGPPERDED